MKLYYIEGSADAPYAGTLDEAKRLARMSATNSHYDVIVSRVEVAIDKQSILRMLNDNGAGAHIVVNEAIYVAKAQPYGRAP